MKKRLLKIVSLALLAVLAVGLCTGPACAETVPPAAEGRRIYFAGPLFNDAEKEYNLKIVTILESYGYEVFLPQRDGYLAADLEGLTEAELTKKIFAKDRDEKAGR